MVFVTPAEGRDFTEKDDLDNNLYDGPEAHVRVCVVDDATKSVKEVTLQASGLITVYTPPMQENAAGRYVEADVSLQYAPGSKLPVSIRASASPLSTVEWHGTVTFK